MIDKFFTWLNEPYEAAYTLAINDLREVRDNG